MAEAGAEVRIGVDIGGTFTDIVLERGPRADHREGADDPRRAGGRGAPGPRPGNGVLWRRTARGGAGHPRHHARHQRDDRAQGRAHRAGDHRGLPRFHRDGDREPLRAVRHRHGEAGAAGARGSGASPCPERLNAAGDPILALDEAAVEATAARLAAEGIESAAIGLLHSYVNPAHERRVREILQAALPELAITLSSEVGAGDARVRALLHRLRQRLRPAGHGALPAQPGGGLARRGLPLPRSSSCSPAAASPTSGRRSASPSASSNPGRWAAPSSRATSPASAGSTACSPSTWAAPPPRSASSTTPQPQTTRAFEVARAHRFLKGSGLPLRIPVIEMVEIGAGGRLHRPCRPARPHRRGAGERRRPAGARLLRPGAALEPTVTDADLAMGRIDPAEFSGGRIALDEQAATGALTAAVGAPARPRAADGRPRRERDGGREHGEPQPASTPSRSAPPSGERTMIAFGGAAPLHAARLAEKARHGPHHDPDGRGGGLCRGLPARASRLRGGAQRLPGGERIQPRAHQSRAGRDAGRGRRHRGARGAGRRDAGDPRRLHALSRPGARGRGAVAQPHLGARGHRDHPGTPSRPPTKRFTGASSRSSTSKS